MKNAPKDRACLPSGAFEQAVRQAVADDPLSVELMDAMLSARAALWRQYCRATELNQAAVPHHLEDAATVLGYGGIEELATMLAQRTQRALFIGLHETAVAHNVRSQDGGQTSLNLLLGQSLVPLNRELSYSIRTLMGSAIAEAARKVPNGQ